ncbi:MAG: 2-C-methyl-D-erythritol 4-phosphate cytidylyltransferase [Bacteroidales bacterium]|nr:2-C-methyl-D-erythritol 4-phosphate cytidylyltransferase [Bacteroidales bacterium]
MDKNNRYAVILAAGEGRRMHSSLPKQFMELDGKPVLRCTLERFLEFDPQIRLIVVLPADRMEYWKEYCHHTGFRPAMRLVAGGLTRFHSVQNALEHVPEDALVAIHDGVRPLISNDFLTELFEKAARHRAVIPVLPLVESVRELQGAGLSRAVDRSRFVSVQTPQVFHADLLKRAYAQPYSPAFTDDATVVESLGIKISLCDGRRENLKITTPEDLVLVRSFISLPQENL